MINEETKETRLLLNQLKEFFESSPWKADYLHRIEGMLHRVNEPCELAIAGRVKAGKSSFLNALLGQELAMTGVNETTATINYFRYGCPEDPSRPILVVWTDGREEYHTEEFLNSLQGNSPEAMEKARYIERLEYFVENDILKYVTLVDTPGTDALVAEHEKRAQGYFAQLRDKHSQQSQALTKKADAVIFITADSVPTQHGVSAMRNFFGNQDHSSSQRNAIGMMTKIDLATDEHGNFLPYDKICEMSRTLAELNPELSDVMPVSAGLYSEIKKQEQSGKLKQLQEKLCQIPPSFFDKLLEMDNRFLTEERIYAKKCAEIGVKMLSCQERKEMLGDTIWRVFVIIARELYATPDYAQALQNLYAYSGMGEVLNVLERKFFHRSRTIRCSNILREIIAILRTIELNSVVDLRAEYSTSEKLLALIARSSCTPTEAESYYDFIKKYRISQEQINTHYKLLQNHLRRAEFLQMRFADITDKSHGLDILSKCKENFSPEELQELETLFGADQSHHATDEYKTQRQCYWMARQRRISANVELQTLLRIIISIYAKV